MILFNNIFFELKKHKEMYFIYIPTVTVVFLFAGMLLAYPQTAADGVKKGVDICLATVIPTLFPFIFISQLIQNIGIIDSLAVKSEGLCRFLFGLPGNALSVIIMSLTGGYPVGPMLTSQAYDRGEVTKNEAQRMMLFCFNPGPAFAISAVGFAVYGSKQAGCIIFASVVLSSLIVGIVSGAFKSEAFTAKPTVKESDFSLSSSLINSAENSAKAIINICVWVILFSCLGSLMEILPINKNLFMHIKSVAEVTSGVAFAGDYFSPAFICALVSFGGFCTHMQIMPFLLKVRLKYSKFFAVRLIVALVSGVISAGLFRIFPQALTVASMSFESYKVESSVSVPVSIFLLLMCGVFILGDSYVVKRKKT